jgi:hypothetical protein
MRLVDMIAITCSVAKLGIGKKSMGLTNLGNFQNQENIGKDLANINLDLKNSENSAI